MPFKLLLFLLFSFHVDHLRLNVEVIEEGITKQYKGNSFNPTAEYIRWIVHVDENSGVTNHQWE